jgi:uncharacterized protein
MAKKKIAVVYHGKCPDGFGGAWAAFKKFGNAAEYIGAADRKHPPEGLEGKEVYFIDWVYPEATMAGIMASAKKVIALDHHVTSEAATKMASAYSYAVDNSGAVLAWRFFFPGKPVPRLLLHIEDMDLWTFRLPQTKKVAAYLDTQPFDFKVWSGLVKAMESPHRRKQLLEKGALILKYQEKVIQELLGKAEPVEFMGHRVLALNSPVFASETGGILAEEMPPFAIVWRETHGDLRVSLRSRNDFDVSVIAQKFGGGGHAQSAGFTLPGGTPLPWKHVK